MITLSFNGGETLEILCPFFHKKMVIYTMNKARLPHIKTASPMHPSGKSKYQPSAKRRQQNLDRLALRTAILSQRLEDGLAKTWMERTRDKAIARACNVRSARHTCDDNKYRTNGSSTKISRSR